MLDGVIKHIEFAAIQLSSAGLLGAGIACTIGGLIIWLAGLNISRLACAVVGGFAGCFSAYAFLTTRFELLALAAFVGVGAGLLIELLVSHVAGDTTYGYNFIMAILSSASGAVLCLLGLAFLLYFKGADPMKYVQTSQKLYLTLLLAMFVFGTLEQLLLCKKKASPTIHKKPSMPEKYIEAVDKESWRNR